LHSIEAGYVAICPPILTHCGPLLWPARASWQQRPHLRDLVDREAEERRRLIAALTDQRARPWWRRWLR
jgi:hypothetical protein